MLTFSEQVVDQFVKIKEQEAALAGTGCAIESDSVKAHLAIARSNLLIAKALDRIASKIRNK